jgi:multidrug efflux pump subunit AcrA (membrane-fusion protein)
VQSIGARLFVFLPVKDNDGSFALREVRLGSAAGGYYSVLEGLKVNDEVVTDGSHDHKPCNRTENSCQRLSGYSRAIYYEPREVE